MAKTFVFIWRVGVVGVSMLFFLTDERKILSKRLRNIKRLLSQNATLCIQNYSATKILENAVRYYSFPFLNLDVPFYDPDLSKKLLQSFPIVFRFM